MTKGEAQYNKLLESLHEQRADIGERLDSGLWVLGADDDREDRGMVVFSIKSDHSYIIHGIIETYLHIMYCSRLHTMILLPDGGDTVNTPLHDITTMYCNPRHGFAVDEAEARPLRGQAAGGICRQLGARGLPSTARAPPREDQGVI